jgi:dephospho-CoA kinase
MREGALWKEKMEETEKVRMPDMPEAPENLEMPEVPIRNFFVIGVTGGIGSGKTAVSSILVERGARLLDADALSRQVTGPGMPALEEIAYRFGSELVEPAGCLDRKRLAAMIFADTEKRRELEAIIHRRVVEAIDGFLREWRDAGYDGVAVLDVPIPVARGFLDNCDEVWVVESPDVLRVQRVQQRSGLTEEDIRIRMSAQLSPDAYRALATRIVVNDGSLAELRGKVFRLLDEVSGRTRSGS